VLAGDGYDARREVDLEVADGQPRVPRPAGAPQDGAHARDELVVDERLHHIVIASPGESAHTIDRIAPRADHDHRHIAVPGAAGLAFAQAAADLEPGSIREHGVEEDEARPCLLDELERRRTAVGGEHLEAVVGELLLQI
jgi:hypothetical protein